MKRVFCVCMAMILCFCICGCYQEQTETMATLPSLSADEVDTISAEELQDKLGSNAIRGIITEKLHPNVLLLSIDEYYHMGKYVYILTDEVDEWCIGDDITVLFAGMERPHDTTQYPRIIATKIRPTVYGAKPIIYLYPTTPTVCSVNVRLNGQLTCTYPDHGTDGWQNFTSYPDGTLLSPDGEEYYALYWEGVLNGQWDLSRGWCVPGSETAEFLEWALAQMGLNRREANEFIVYWLPMMQENAFNVISFQTEAYADCAKLEITPAPDSMLRVFMIFYATETPIEMQPQVFDDFERLGFTVVEWGGGQVSAP